LARFTLAPQIGPKIEFIVTTRSIVRPSSYLPKLFVSSLIAGGSTMSGCGSAEHGQPPPAQPVDSSQSAALANAPSDAPASASVVDAALLGQFQHVGGQADVHQRDAAIQAAIADLPSRAHGRAREQLTRMATIAERFIIESVGEGVRISVNDQVQITAPLGGAPVEFTTPEGKTVDVAFTLQGSSLVQTVQGSRGGSRRTYVAQPEGKLVVRVTVSAERLPRDIVYDLHYARVDSSESGSETEQGATPQ
jgi:hypothetical protein